MAELSRAIARLMEERKRETQRPIPEVVPPPEAIEQAADEARERVAPGERSLADAFVRQFATSAGAEAMEEKELTALAMVAFRFLIDRNPEEPRVRVFDADLAREGWSSAGTTIQIALRGRPFIEDTVRLCLAELDCVVQRLLVASFSVERDPRRVVLAIGAPGLIGTKEVLVHIEVDRFPEPRVLASLLSRRLGDLILATNDYQPMRARLERAIEELRTCPPAPPWREEAEEVAAYLGWLGERNFVFLGYREYQFEGQGAERTAVVKRGSGLGILQAEDRSSFATAGRLQDVVRRRINEPPLLMISKTNAESPVQRRGHMDYVGLKEIDSSGVVVGERRWLGLFSDRALTAESATIPLLREKLARLLVAEGAAAGSEDARLLAQTFNSLPKSEALGLSVPDLRSEVRTIRGAASASDAQVSYHFDSLDRATFALVTLPRERFAAGLYGMTEQRLLRATGASTIFDRTLVNIDGEPVRMHFYLNVPPETVRGLPARDLEAPVLSVLRTWDDRLRDELGRQFDRHQAAELADRYVAAFPAAYQRDNDVRTVVRDIGFLEDLRTDRMPRSDVVVDEQSTAGRQGRIKIYCVSQQLVLGDLIVSLMNFGLSVLSARAVRIAIPGLGEADVHDLGVQNAEGAAFDAQHLAPLLRAALQRLQRGGLRDDRLNALIIRARLEWREIDLLRLYVGYAAQLHEVASRDGLEAVLLRFPQSARLLWEYFLAKFDPLEPSSPRDRLGRALTEVEQRFAATLQSGQSPNEARLLRLLFGIVQATVRTNYFRFSASGTPEEGGEDLAPLAIKIDSAAVPEISGLRPRYEVFVDGYDMQGLYARRDRVARGGIFFLDAGDQLRLRVLDRLRVSALATGTTAADAAQGAFTVRRAGRGSVTIGQVQAGYRQFLSSLIGLTDNIDRGRVVPPPGTVLYDTPDPYLHVSDGSWPDAYSETARTLANESGFWMGEAIAAGPSQGAGAEVVARGAWEAARRHFQELGGDADRDTLSVVAIGRLDSPQFAHGLLLSRRLRLLAALDEEWILLDPDPDLSRSFVERERLIATTNSAWANYDKAMLSEGGAILPRSAAKIELNSIQRGMLAIDRETASGEEIAKAVLLLSADLMWCGDAGLYVKSREQSHAEVGDAANDRVRIDAEEVRCRVIVEVGPAFTQAGRVALAMVGGRIDTDAADGSSGVILGERDSNTRLAVMASAEGGGLTAHEQARVLQEAAPDNATEVLVAAHHRTRALHRDLLRSQTGLDEFFDLLAQLDADRVLERRREALPDREAVRRRRAQFNGLTRPELAVLNNGAKTWLRQRLLATNLPDDTSFEPYLRDYFSQLINDRCGQGVRSHRLRRDIIASQLANTIVDMMGSTFVTRISAAASVDPTMVVTAWSVAAAACDANGLWREIVDSDPPLPVAAELACWEVLTQALERATRWLVFTQPHDVAASVLAETFVDSAHELLAALPSIQPAAAQQKIATMVERIANAGVPRALPQRIVPLLRMVELLDIVQMAIERGRAHTMVAEAYYRLDDLLELDWIEERLTDQAGDDPWAQRAIEALREELIAVRRELTEQLLITRPEATTVDEGLHDYLVANQLRLRRVGDLMDDITSTPHPTLAGLLVVVRELRRLSEERGG